MAAQGRYGSVGKQFVQFSGVGAIGTGAHYLVLVVLVQLAGLGPVTSSVAGFLAGALVNYSLNYRFTFRSSKRHAEAMTKFFVVAVVGLLFNTAIMALAVNQMGLHYLWSQILATISVLIWNFSANRVWTFRP